MAKIGISASKTSGDAESKISRCLMLICICSSSADGSSGVGKRRIQYRLLGFPSVLCSLHGTIALQNKPLRSVLTVFLLVLAPRDWQGIHYVFNNMRSLEICQGLFRALLFPFILSAKVKIKERLVQLTPYSEETS